MAVWYVIIDELRTYLRTQPTPAARHIEGGALDPENLDLSADANGLTGAIFLIRDREIVESIHKGGEGVAIFYAENWIRSDNPDPLVGYAALSIQEDAFKKALTAWVYGKATATGSYDLTNLEIDETIGDADSRRPYLGSRTTVRVTWSKRTI